MGLRMPSPTKRDGSSVFQIRERVPADIRRRVPEFPVIFELPAFGNEPARTVSATARHQVKFSLGTRDPAAAKARSGIAKAHLEKLYASLRSGPTILSQKESVALSGEVYRLFVARFEENPGSVNAWTAVKAFNRAAAEGRLGIAKSIVGRINWLGGRAELSTGAGAGTEWELTVPRTGGPGD